VPVADDRGPNAGADMAGAMCYICHATLEEVGTLFGCFHCGRVMMCRPHIGGLITVDGHVRAVCCVCLRLPEH